MQQDGKALAAPFLWSVALFPASVLLHELGHVLVGLVGGFPMVLHHASASGLPEAPPWGGAPLLVGLASLAGPLVTLLLVVLGMANGGRSWGAPLVMAAIPRFAGNIVYMLQQGFVLAGIAEPSSPNFDEVVGAAALGLPPHLVAAVGAVLFVAALVWLWRRAGGRGFFMLVGGVGASMSLWFGVMGPILLP